jgi:hypothetical protein
VLGCMATAATVVVTAARRPLPVSTGEKALPSVRGPAGYVGPGSLGATKSTARR